MVDSVIREQFPHWETGQVQVLSLLESTLRQLNLGRSSWKLCPVDAEEKDSFQCKHNQGEGHEVQISVGKGSIQYESQLRI